MKSYRSWHENNVYNEEIELAFFDCDLRRKAKLSSIMKFIADSAGKDYAARGLSHQALLEKNQVFLLSRLSIHFERMPVNDEIITVKTWERGISGPYFHRDYEIFDGLGRNCVSATSAWVLVDPRTRQIQRPSKFSHHIVPEKEMLSTCRSCERIKPPENMSLIGNRTIMFSDIDGNGHVYNANYGSIATDFLPHEMQVKDLHNFSINFIREAKQGEILDIYSSFEKESGRIVVMGKNGENNCFECELFYLL